MEELIRRRRQRKEGETSNDPSAASHIHEFPKHQIDFLRQLMKGQLYESASVLLRCWTLMVYTVLIFLILLLVMIFVEKICRMGAKDFNFLETFAGDQGAQGPIPPGPGSQKMANIKILPWLSVSVLLLLALTQRQFYFAITGVVPALSGLFLFIERIRNLGKTKE